MLAPPQLLEIGSGWPITRLAAEWLNAVLKLDHASTRLLPVSARYNLAGETLWSIATPELAEKPSASTRFAPLWTKSGCPSSARAAGDAGNGCRNFSTREFPVSLAKRFPDASRLRPVTPHR